MLLHHFDSSTRMVAVNLLYNVGSSDELVPRTGLAHLLEHLMFTGSKNIAEFDRVLQEAGGESNAWTSVDATNYYEVLPATNLETALWLESDRLMSLTLADESIKAQKSVVSEEFKQRCHNAPYGDLSHLMSQLAYKEHPYQWPAIGRSIDDIEALTVDDVRNFHSVHYAANNLILCISGNVTFDDAVSLVEKWFADISPRHLAPRNHPREPLQTQPRLQRVERNVPQTVIYRAYHSVGRRHSEYPASDILSDILSNGKSARFYRNVLMQSGLFSELDAAVSGTIDNGLFFIRARLLQDASIDQAQHIIDHELRQLLAEGVSSYEVEKFVNKHISTTRFENLGYLQQAMRLCMYEQLGDASLIDDEESLYKKLTSEDVTEAARKILNPEHSSTLIYTSCN